jgi:hypothetical protein
VSRASHGAGTRREAPDTLGWTKPLAPRRSMEFAPYPGTGQAGHGSRMAAAGAIRTHLQTGREQDRAALSSPPVTRGREARGCALRPPRRATGRVQVRMRP